MNKHLKQAVLSVAALTIGLTVTACAQNGTVRPNTVRTKNNVHNLATDGYTNRWAARDGVTGTDGMTGYNTNLNRTYTPNAIRNNNGMYGSNMNNMSTTNDTHYSRTVKQIASQAEKVQGVNRASVVVHNNDCIVGLDTNNRNVAGIEKSVRNTLEKKYPSYKFHVTSDKKLHTRITGLHTNMSNNYTNNNYTRNTGTMNNMNYGTDGHPIRDLATDVGDLIRDIGNAVTAPLR